MSSGKQTKGTEGKAMTAYIYAVHESYDGKLSLEKAEIVKETAKQIKTERSTGAAFGYHVIHDPARVHRTAEAAVRAYIQRKDAEVEALHCEAAAASEASSAAEKLLPLARKIDKGEA